MLPDGWSEATLGDIAKISGGSTPSKAEPTYWGGDIRWLTPSEVTAVSDSNRYISETREYITKAGLQGSSLQLYPAGTVLMTSRATIGEVVINTRPMTTNQGFCNFVPTDKITNTYLAYWLTNAKPILLTISSGSTFLEISKTSLRALNVWLPPLPEQKRIAEVLGSVDAAIEATKAVIDQTKTVKQGLLQTLLTRGIGHTKFKESPLGEIPETWEVKTLGELAGVERGKFSARPRNDPQFFGGKYPFIQTGEIAQSDGYLTSFSQTLNDSGLSVSRLFKKETIVITIAANIGDVAILGMDAAFPDSLVGISAFKGVNYLWLYYFLKTQKEYLDSKSTQNAQKNINLQILRPLFVPVPPLSEQDALADIFVGVDKQLSSETSKLATLQTLKKGLMNDLLTGRVRVEVASTTETQASNVVPFTLTAPVDAVRKHAVLSAEITAQLYHLNTFGATKREKLTDLVVRHVGLDETTDRQASRHAAGSYDPKARREIDDIFEREHWFKIQRGASAVKFLKGTAFGGHKTEFEEQFGSVKLQVQKVINLLRDYDTRHCEIIDTLYTAWNDFLIEGKSPSDDEIITEVLTNWHDSKLTISRQDWRSGLSWMRERDFVPSGHGRSTKPPSFL